MNKKLGLDLDLPPREEGRSLSAAPMDNFLRKAGIPEQHIAGCVEEYEQNFKVDFPVKPFNGTEECVAALHGTHKLAIVTSNTSANVTTALGPALADQFAFILGIDNGPQSKVESIRLALEQLRVSPQEACYVGDTKKDHDCAQANGVGFIAANYGFEDLEVLHLGCPLANSVSEIPQLLQIHYS